ncbi:hypothetical protein DICSQDRAFT_133529 [Dichomitus squalens LYAD-421 SS1]|uniref:uncharacterized protein n=1 Tax=Dichomitus squalens (strain LYAD-421) TaxID=732165 RepID=UPI0004415462|nr:uncharacterized protein DICSQDRAFT_133529 [Dichomitus squalens LYAD-421 SS1]EJF64818.1 hypothetical protein DICSQDRAFT_133529 [Dichomitus squalens LYAD-421 SS1]
MQLTIISQTHALLTRPFSLQSNSFCAGDTSHSNGTPMNVGDNPVVEDHTAAADFGDVDGLQAIRIFEPCQSDNVGEVYDLRE